MSAYSNNNDNNDSDNNNTRLSQEPPISVDPLMPNIPDSSVVEKLLQDRYGLTVVSLTPLNGYDDKNYCAKVCEESTTKNGHHQSTDISATSTTSGSSRKLFVKVVNSKDSKCPELMGE